MRLLRRRPRPKGFGDGETSRWTSDLALGGGMRFFCLPIRLLIVAEEEIVQVFLHHAFGDSSQFKVVAVTSEASEAIYLSRFHHVDVILLNLMMPRMAGLAALERLKSQLPFTKIISFSVSSSKDVVAVGANAVLDKMHRPVSELPLVLNDVLHGLALAHRQGRADRSRGRAIAPNNAKQRS